MELFDSNFRILFNFQHQILVKNSNGVSRNRKWKADLTGGCPAFDSQVKDIRSKNVYG